MTHTYQELHDMTVAQMRDLAQGVEHEAVAGYSTMHKEDLLQALCTAFGIEAHVHHEVVGIDKAAIKRRIRQLKLERQKAIDAADGKELKRIRRQIHRLKRTIRKATI